MLEMENYSTEQRTKEKQQQQQQQQQQQTTPIATGTTTTTTTSGGVLGGIMERIRSSSLSFAPTTATATTTTTTTTTFLPVECEDDKNAENVDYLEEDNHENDYHENDSQKGRETKTHALLLVMEDDTTNANTSTAYIGSSNTPAVLLLEEQVSQEDEDEETTAQSEQDLLMMPLIMASEESLTLPTTLATTLAAASATNESGSIRSRKQKKEDSAQNKKRKRNRRKKQGGINQRSKNWCPGNPLWWRSTMNAMNFLARLLFWGSVVATVAAVVWYSYELKNNGTDPHLIAWFSAGAFVLLGFPISMYGIVMHLANYNQPNIQMYIVRILWMVPIYSMESWLCLRFHRYAIYIETLRDVYESYVLYSFLQYLIQVLGGEEELILMLKDKSPTRGVHMWGIQYCYAVKPWLMGQPVSRTVYSASSGKPIKKIIWTSPFFVQCKFGVLQYVLLKFVSTIFVMILELNGLYKEGDFTYKGGYLYICIVTNVSQCWALYCLIFFYYATKNELSPIRPVGKFLSVKSIVFFTWWQSVCISLIYQMDLIPHYHASNESEWTSEDVAKGLQDYLICIEMFVGAIVHVFVFPHTDYLPQAVQARKSSIPAYGHASAHAHANGMMRRQLGRRRHNLNNNWLFTSNKANDDFSAASKNSGDVEMANHILGSGDDYSLTATAPMVLEEGDEGAAAAAAAADKNDTATATTLGGGGKGSTRINTLKKPSSSSNEGGTMMTRRNTMDRDEDDDDDDDDDDADDDDDIPDDSECSMDDGVVPTIRTGFVKALIESTIPRDVIDSSVGIVQGAYHVEKKTLLHHAATSDQYDLFSSSRRFLSKATKQLEGKD